MEELQDCTFEVVLYDAKRWWNLADIFSPLPHQGIGIRYDEDFYVVWTSHRVYKVKASKLAKHITWSEKKNVSCRAHLVGKVWLSSCLAHHQEFENGKEFLARYVSIMTGVKIGKRN